MDDAALYALATGTARNGLARASHLLTIIGAQPAPDDVLASALAPGMFACGDQLLIAIGFCERCVYPVIGSAVPNISDSVGNVDLVALAAQTSDRLNDITRAAFDGAAGRVVTHQAGEATLQHPAAVYLRDFAIPNLWFHVSMAYAILRRAGIEIGKADFDGLHSYPAGFRFT